MRPEAFSLVFVEGMTEPQEPDLILSPQPGLYFFGSRTWSVVTEDLIWTLGLGGDFIDLDHPVMYNYRSNVVPLAPGERPQPDQEADEPRSSSQKGITSMDHQKVLQTIKAFHKKCGMEEESQSVILRRSIGMRLGVIESRIGDIKERVEEVASDIQEQTEEIYLLLERLSRAEELEECVED